MEREIQSESTGLEEAGEDQETAEIIKEAQELGNNESKEPESVEDSIREALKEVQAEDLRDKDQEGEEKAEPLDVAAQKAPAQEQAQTIGKEDPTDYEPPSRLSATEKDLFNKLPKKFKPAVARMFKDHQTELRNTQNQLASERKEAVRQREEASHVIQAVRPYYTAHPELAENGVTEGHLVAALIGAHQKLTNPKTDRQAIEKLAADRGYRIKFVDDDGNEVASQAPKVADISAHPEFKALQESNSRVLSFLDQQRINNAARPVIEAFESVKAEKDSSGRHIYPQLQNPQFWGFAKSLILQKINAGQAPAEAVKSAYVEILGPASAAPLNSSNQVSLPRNNQQTNRAVSAAMTVRGKIAPASNASRTLDTIPRDESIEQSIMAALEEARRGN